MRLSCVAVLLSSLVACKAHDAPPQNARAASIDAAPAAASVDHVAIARAFVDAIGKGDLAAAEKLLEPDVAKNVTADALQKMWTARAGALGAYQGSDEAKAYPEEGKDRVVVIAKLAGGTVRLVMRLGTGKALIGGLHVDPGEPTVAYAAPAYVDATEFACASAEIGVGPLALPGTFCAPKGAGPWPLVIFVHGSGGGDRDDALAGGARPFRDLAEGLASRGIASLRFDKRTHGENVLALRMKIADLTVKEEYLDDFAAAVTTAAALPGVDAKRIFVAGHSEGGWLTPMLLQLHPEVAGGITLAGNARPFGTIIPAQVRAMSLANDGKIDPMEQLAIDGEEAKAKRAMDPKLSPDTPPAELPLGVAPKYWLSLQRYDAPAVADALDRPLLILQGARDYQVTADDDLALWKKALAGKANVDTKLYPKLNHAFFAGEGPITPAEYGKLGHVDAEVVDDMAAWIGKH